VPCTLTKMQQLIAAGELPREQPPTADAAKAFPGFVQATHAHSRNCPYCRCGNCKNAYQKRGPLNPEDFTLAVNCQGSRK
jgi:hypothetical protein